MSFIKQTFAVAIIAILSINSIHIAQANTNAKPNNASNNQSNSVITPANPHDPNAPTLLEALSPNDSELSKANTELLAKNAELARQVDNLSIQVNVLTQERSGQLFTYGATTALICIIIGFILARLAGRNRW